MPLPRRTIPLPMPLPRPVLRRTIPLPVEHIPFQPNILDPANISSGEFILPPWTVDIPKIIPLLLSMPPWIREDTTLLLYDGPYVRMKWKPVDDIYHPYCHLCGRWADLVHFDSRYHSDSKARYYAEHDVTYRVDEHAMAPLTQSCDAASSGASQWPERDAVWL